MIAKVTINIPFTVTIPVNENFDIYPYEIEGYKVNLFPLLPDEKLVDNDDLQFVKFDGKDTYNTNILQLVFRKDTFDRNQSGIFDPPISLIEKVSNDFLNRYRFVLNAYDIKPIHIDSIPVRVIYLNDDESKLSKEEGLVQGRIMGIQYYKVRALNNQIWKDIHSIKPFSTLPTWNNLLLDSKAMLPEIGPSIVLVFTALEVFISKTLDDIAIHKKIDPELWDWINNRKYFLKEPSIEEQYDFLCRHFLGISIKDNTNLWQAFKNLQKARNSFAHTGIAEIGDETVDVSRADDLINKAEQIIHFIRDNLPEELKWKIFNQDIKIELAIKMSNSLTAANK